MSTTSGLPAPAAATLSTINSNYASDFGEGVNELDPTALASIQGVMDTDGVTETDIKSAIEVELAKDAYVKVGGTPNSFGDLSAAEIDLLSDIQSNMEVDGTFDAGKLTDIKNQLTSNGHLSAAVAEVNAAAANPTTNNINTASNALNSAVDSIQQLGDKGVQNLMEVLFLVFKESITDTNESKKLFMKKLMAFNTIAEKISDYLSYLTDASAALSAASAGEEYPSKVMTDVPIAMLDINTSGLGTGGQAVTVGAVDDAAIAQTDADIAALKADMAANPYRRSRSGSRNSGPMRPPDPRIADLADLEATRAGQATAQGQGGYDAKPMDRAALNTQISKCESMQETVRNNRQMATTAFQSFEQKGNQLYNLLSSVMKTMNEMRTTGIRNML